MTVAESIAALANDQAAFDARRTGGHLDREPATAAEILDTVHDPATGRTTAWFVFDYVILHSAQSGSDWYFHHVFAGRATLLHDRVVESTLVRLREDNVTEFAMEWAPAGERYDRPRVREADRDAWWSKTRAQRRAEAPT